MLSAKFQYTGDLLHIGTLVVRDLARWLTIAKIEMEKSEILFIQAYDKAYKNNGSSSIYLTDTRNTARSVKKDCLITPILITRRIA